MRAAGSGHVRMRAGRHGKGNTAANFCRPVSQHSWHPCEAGNSRNNGVGMLRTIFALASGLIAGAFSVAGDAVAAGGSEPWQMGFQTPASPVMDRIVEFHDQLFVIEIMIVVLVMGNPAHNLHPFQLQGQSGPGEDHRQHIARSHLDWCFSLHPDDCSGSVLEASLLRGRHSRSRDDPSRSPAISGSGRIPTPIMETSISTACSYPMTN